MTDLKKDIEEILNREDECEDQLAECHWKEDTASKILALFEKRDRELIEKIKGMKVDKNSRGFNAYDFRKNEVLDSVIELIKQ